MKYNLLLIFSVVLNYFAISFTGRCCVTKLKFCLKNRAEHGLDTTPPSSIIRGKEEFPVSQLLEFKHLPKKMNRVKVTKEKLVEFEKLPFTNREEELVAFSQAAMMDEFKLKDHVSLNPYDLTLCVSGRLSGSGKTAFGTMLHQVIGNKLQELKPGSHVHYVYMNHSSLSLLKEELRSLKFIPDAVIDAPGRSDTIKDLMCIVTDYLATNNPNHYLFLHLDDFTPPTLEDFCTVWKSTLFPIQQMKHVFMYVSGENAYYNQIGNWGQVGSPTGVLNTKLNSLDLKHVKESIEAIDICSDDGTQSLSLHDKLVGADITSSFTPSQRAELDELWNQLLIAIYDSSCGVPLIVQLLLQNMFELQKYKIFNFSPARAIKSFYDIQNTIKECIEQVKPEGDAGIACMKNAKLAIVKKYTTSDLLRAIHLTLNPLKLQSLDDAMLSDRENRLLAHADKFRFARSYDSEKEEIEFKIPGVVKYMIEDSELFADILKDVKITSFQKD